MEKLERNEKKLRYEEISKKVEKIVDNLGKPIDKEIKKPVISLMLHNFKLYQSCKGHLDKKGLPYPWIAIHYPEPKNLMENEKVKEKYEKKNLKQQLKMIKLLDEFYKKRKVDYDIRLFPHQYTFNKFELQSIGGSVMNLLPEKEKEKKLKKYQKEMNDFGEFLKQKYFNS